MNLDNKKKDNNIITSNELGRKTKNVFNSILIKWMMGWWWRGWRWREENNQPSHITLQTKSWGLGKKNFQLKSVVFATSYHSSPGPKKILNDRIDPNWIETNYDWLIWSWFFFFFLIIESFPQIASYLLLLLFLIILIDQFSDSFRLEQQNESNTKSVLNEVYEILLPLWIRSNWIFISN